MHPSSRAFRLGLAVLLVVAPLCELVETVVSPLTSGSTVDDLHAIAAHQSAFVVSVLVGVLATALYVPAFLGIARLTWQRSRRLSVLAGTSVVLAMLGFMGIRMAQAVELQGARDGLGATRTAHLIDGVAANPIGGTVFALFMGGTVIGVVCTAAAVWRARLAPVPAVVLLAAFPFLDLLTPGYLGTLLAHAVLLVGLGWIGLALTRTSTDRTESLVAVGSAAG